MGDPFITPEDRYDALVEALLGHAGVTIGLAGKKGFGSAALCINNRIFAMLVKGRLVVKLPRQRVDALIAPGERERFDPGHGRLMKEWLTVAPANGDQWLPLAREALAYATSRR